MLQQTSVDRVVDRYHAFLERFPDPATCAARTLGEVLTLWQGLGYPRRAQRLHAAAGVIVNRFGGQVPVDLEDLSSLPGVGAYTARAIRAFAHEAPAAVVDTNIARVLARVMGESLSAAAAQRLADTWAEGADVWHWNQTIMELGALRCRPVPRCSQCPIASECHWHRHGYPDPDPARATAGVSVPQARFEGSVRQARGRVLGALVAAAGDPVVLSDLAEVMGRNEATARDIVEGLISEGLIERVADSVRLATTTAQDPSEATTAPSTASNTSSA
jgi:A/G-specific adenine glycosylase